MVAARAPRAGDRAASAAGGPHVYDAGADDLVALHNGVLSGAAGHRPTNQASVVSEADLPCLCALCSAFS